MKLQCTVHLCLCTLLSQHRIWCSRTDNFFLSIVHFVNDKGWSSCKMTHFCTQAFLANPEKSWSIKTKFWYILLPLACKRVSESWRKLRSTSAVISSGFFFCVVYLAHSTVPAGVHICIKLSSIMNIISYSNFSFVCPKALYKHACAHGGALMLHLERHWAMHAQALSTFCIWFA